MPVAARLESSAASKTTWLLLATKFEPRPGVKLLRMGGRFGGRVWLNKALSIWTLATPTLSLKISIAKLPTAGLMYAGFKPEETAASNESVPTEVSITTF